EPRLTLAGQSRLWTYGYVALALLTALTAILTLRHRTTAAQEATDVTLEPETKLTWAERGRWVLLSAAPASLMLGITTYLTTNIAPIPFLWVIPLALYLISFIFEFSSRVRISSKLLIRISTILVLPIALVLVLELWVPMVPLAGMHLAVFFVIAWTCHTLLSQSRPSASHLTEFYLWIAAGGVAGGAFNAFFAPVFFNGLIEYPIALAVALAVIQSRSKPVIEHKVGDMVIVPARRHMALWADLGVAALVCVLLFGLSFLGPKVLVLVNGRWGETAESAIAMIATCILLIGCFFAIDRPIRYGLVLGAVMIFAPAMKRTSGLIIYQARNFFGVKRVYSSPDNSFHDLLHGSILHGRQNLKPELRREPLTYYNPKSPIGSLFQEFSGPKAKQSVAVIGLGAGTLAAYGERGQHWTFYEIDPEMIRIATDPKLFTYLADSKAQIEIVQGDGRLEIAKAPPAGYDLIMLDAFSSDSVPVHLLTLEAIKIYESKLKPGGIIAFHTSNKYLQLPPVLARGANALGLKSIYFSMDLVSPEEEQKGWTISRWILMARDEKDFAGLAKKRVWEHMDKFTGGPVWTDDFSNVLGAFGIDES
ncbi:MAG: hypothetical protein QOJ65_1961, partial [Fimbriimonadaceae bacterium]|nr:hypothetical protein [Fimbriimonadaceae bacterium]